MIALAAGIHTFAADAQNSGSDWKSLNDEAERSYTRGDLKAAIRIAKQAVEASSSPHESGHSLDRLGFFEYTAGDLKAGEASLRKALELREEEMGEDSADYAESANDLALLMRDSGRPAEAKTLAEAAVAIRRRVFGAGDPRVAESLNTLGSSYGLLGEYEQAITRFEEAKRIHESGPESSRGEEYGTLCINLAGTYQRIGKYQKAEATFEEGLEVLRVRPGINHPAYSASLTAYAYLQADLGHYAEAEKLYDESGRLLKAQLGEQHPVYAAFLNNRAALYAALGKRGVAEADYHKSIDLKRKIFPPNSPTIGASLRNLARLVSLRDSAEGGKLFAEAVQLYESNSKPPPFDYASALLGLAESQRKRGELGAARATLLRASEVTSAGLGGKHPLYGALLRDLGLVHRSAHEFPEAEECLEKAIAIVSESQGSDHPDLAHDLKLLAEVYDDSGDYKSAEPLYRSSLEISDRALAEMLAIGSEEDKSRAIASLDDPIPRLLTFQRRAGDVLPSVRRLAFEAVAQRKGRLLDAVHDWAGNLREHSDDRIRRPIQDRKAMMECEASLTIALGYRDLKPAVVGGCSLPGTDLAGRYERLLHDLRSDWTDALGKQAIGAIAVLREHIGSLESVLSREVPQFVPSIEWVGLEDIAVRLKAGELLVEFARYSDDTGNVPERYGAFLLDRSEDLRWVDLGPARPMDQTVQDLIAAANDWSVAAGRGESRSAAEAKRTATQAIEKISRILRPLTAELHRRSDIRFLRVAPDGMLNLVPFAALYDAVGRRLVERFAISYLSAGRDLATRATGGNGTPNGTVVAVSPGMSSRANVTARTAQAFIRADQFARLTSAEQEAGDVQKWLPRAKLLGQDQATEANIKALRRPALLHIIGHGIVRGNENCRVETSAPGCELSGMTPAARVMSLSAIVLEEAYGRGDRSREDGLLTALELQTLDLRGTEMLVLSQCRMADGVPTSGEGFYGMRRAAAIAGVKTFVAPLWNVADASEREVMDRFYGELSAGKGRAEALRTAQLALRRSRHSSFLEWAPVILTGDPGPLPRELFTR